MPVRDLIASDIRVLGTAKVTINSATTTNFDFGTPDDINLAGTTGPKKGERIVVVLDASTVGTTDALSWSVQDAPDSSGSIGTPATAVTQGTLTGGTGDQYALIGVRVQAGRPWLRVRVTRVGTTDTHVCQATVLAVPRAV